MNVRELAAEAGLRSAVLLRAYGTEDFLCDSEIAELRHIERLAELVTAHEREECLKCYSPDDTATDWADKIRARGTR